MIESSSTFVQGLYVMIVGMVVVFAALTLVMLSIMALSRIFRPKEEEPVAKAAPAPVAVPAPAADDRDLVAAIATALALRLQETEQAPAPAPVRVLSVQDENRLWTAIGKLQ